MRVCRCVLLAWLPMIAVTARGPGPFFDVRRPADLDGPVPVILKQEQAQEDWFRSTRLSPPSTAP